MDLFDILYAHHGQVVALFGIAHKLVDGLDHLVDELVGFLLLGGECSDSHIVDALHLELFIFGIHRLGEAVGEEQDGGIVVCRLFPSLRHSQVVIGIAPSCQ